MPALLESLLLFVSLVASYLWVSLPNLRPYSLQMTACLLVIFFISKRLSRAAGHHILPNPQSLETAFLTAAIALVVGSTGSIASPFLPLFHLLLFFGALSFTLVGNLVSVVLLTIFLWGTSVHPLGKADLIELLSLPFLLPLLIFARQQFTEAREKTHQLENETEAIAQEEARLSAWLRRFLQPKLRQVRQSLSLTPQNTTIVVKQLVILEESADRILDNLQPDEAVEET